MRTHIKVIGVVTIILNALKLLALVLGALGVVTGSIFSGSLTGFVGGLVGGIVWIVIGGAFALFGLLAGFGLLNHQQWARYVAIVCAVFALFNFPIGTIVGIYTLWVLFNDETKRIFETGAP